MCKASLLIPTAVRHPKCLVSAAPRRDVVRIEQEKKKKKKKQVDTANIYLNEYRTATATAAVRCPKRNLPSKN